MPKNQLNLRLTQLAGTEKLTTSQYIPQQTLRLVSYRAEFDTAAHALACKILRFSSTWLGGNATQFGIDVTDNSGYLEIYGNKGVTVNLQDAIVTEHSDCQHSYDMTQDCYLTFDYAIYGVDTTGFVELWLQFEYDIGVL